MPTTVTARTLLLIATGVAITGCSGGPAGTDEVLSVASVSVLPERLTLEPGQVGQLRATPKAEDGTTVHQTATWRSVDPAIATVSASGAVTAVAPGAATIAAGLAGTEGTAVVAVLGPVASVRIAPESLSIAQWETTGGVVEVRDTGANVLRRTPVTWRSEDPAVASVAPDGKVFGVAAGSAEITASAGGIAGKVVVTVRPPLDLSGTWSVTEAGGCIASGTVTLSQDPSVPTVAGAYQSSGRCPWTTRARSTDITGTRQLTGSIAGTGVDLQSSGALSCTYQGGAEGDPVTRIHGLTACDVSIDGFESVRVLGTFTMTRE